MGTVGCRHSSSCRRQKTCILYLWQRRGFTREQPAGPLRESAAVLSQTGQVNYAIVSLILSPPLPAFSFCSFTEDGEPGACKSRSSRPAGGRCKTQTLLPRKVHRICLYATLAPCKSAGKTVRGQGDRGGKGQDRGAFRKSGSLVSRRYAEPAPHVCTSCCKLLRIARSLYKSFTLSIIHRLGKN